jgi:dipeptidase E
MSLVQPSEQRTTCQSFSRHRSQALGLVPFQINPHFLDADPSSTHMGETREERILQFLEENDTPVAGLREGAMVLAENDSYLLKGSSGARIFRKGQDPVEVSRERNSIIY